MKALDPRAAARHAVAASPSRPAMAVLVESANVRMLVFCLAPGQAVPPHHNASTVCVTVLEGEGMFSGAEGERRCVAGEMVMYEPSETHGFRALDSELLVLATIAPNPAGR